MIFLYIAVGLLFLGVIWILVDTILGTIESEMYGFTFITITLLLFFIVAVQNLVDWYFLE